jgi:hypothetical protein
MGEIERKGKKRALKRNLKGIILKSIAAAGLIGIAIAAPNMLGALRKYGLTQSPYDYGNIVRARKRLIKQGLVSYEGSVLRLTDKGSRFLQLLEAKETLGKKPRRWDGRWRVLIFDIPEYRKNLRNKVRDIIRTVGFTQLQKSVWAYPYDTEDLVILLKADLKIGKDMLYMIVDELEYDSPLRKHFNLPIDR